MAINKPVKKGTAQTESKSTGLTGYRGGKQINKGKDSANKSVGNYSGKTLNLTKKQLGASGRKAAASDKIAISRTRYDTASKKVLGPMGKPITGRVDLGGGNIAVYKQGVRVRATASKPKGGNGGGGGGGGNGGDGPPKKKYGTPYEERKAAIGSGTTKGKPRGAGVPYEERKAAIGGGNARPRTKMQQAAMANPYLGGRAKAVQKQKDGSYSTSSGNKGTTAKAALLARKAQDKKNESRDNTFLASLALAPLLAAGGVAGGAGAGLKGIMAARGAAAARGATAARSVTPASRATQWGKGVPVATKVPPRGAPRVNSNLSPTGPGRGGVPNKKIGPTTTSRDTQWGKGIAVAKPAAKPAAKPRAKPRAKPAAKKKP